MLAVRKIIEGWWRSAMNSNEELLKERAKVCIGCPESKVMPISMWFNGEYEEVKDMACAKCGCPLDKKLRVTDEKCPLNKW